MCSGLPLFFFGSSDRFFSLVLLIVLVSAQCVPAPGRAHTQKMPSHLEELQELGEQGWL